MVGMAPLHYLTWRFKLVFLLGLAVPGLLARSLESRAAHSSEALFVKMGVGSRVAVITARVAYDCGCKSGSRSGDPLTKGIEVTLRFIPSGEASADPFLFKSGDTFVPPVDGHLELATHTLSREAIGELERANSDICSGLDITDVALKELKLEPAQGEP